MSPDLRHSQEHRYEFSQVKGWRVNPLQQMDNIEVKDNMRELVGGRTRSLQDSYLSIRNTIMENAGITVLFYSGRSNAGKSNLAEADYRLLAADEVLKRWESNNGISVELSTWPFSLGMQATKSKGVHERYPDFAVDPRKRHGEYTVDDYAKQSALQEALLEEVVFTNQNADVSQVLLMESSCPTAVPLMEGNQVVGIQGVDRGLRVPYELAVRDETRDSIHYFMIERDEEVNEDSRQFRDRILDQTEKAGVIFRQERNFLLPDTSDAVHLRDEQYVRFLPEDSQQHVRNFLSMTMASPRAQLRSDQEMEEIKQLVSNENRVPIMTDQDYFKYIQESLRLPDEQFHIVINPYFLGDKGHDLSYFLKAIPLQIFPEIQSVL